MQDELRFLPFKVLYLSHQNGGIQKHDQKWRIERKARTKAKPWLAEQQAKQNMNIFYVLCPVWKYGEDYSWRLEASLFSSVFCLTMPCLKGYIFNTTFKRTFNLDKIKFETETHTITVCLLKPCVTLAKIKCAHFSWYDTLRKKPSEIMK